MWPFTFNGYLKTIDQVATPLVHPSNPSRENAKGIQEYDYIIVGGGTAGCVLASRLSENPAISVLVLERGERSASWFSSIPMFGVWSLYHSVVPYAYKWTGTWKEGSVYDNDVDYRKLNLSTHPSLPTTTLSDLETTRTLRQIPMLAGNALGGSTKINVQLYTHAFSGELNAWADSCQDPTWNYQNMRELIKRSENNVTANTAEKEYRGRDGPWLTQKFDKIYFNSCKKVVKACEAIGIPFVTESNHPNGPAIKLTQVERTMTKDGKRITTFDGFLPPKVLKERQSRLTVCTGAVVSSIDIREDRGGLNAKGVFLEPAFAESANAKKYYVAARREVILCGGAFVSPQLLLLSGVGPKKHLEEMGIPVIKALPGVGAHLQDHHPLSVLYTVPIEDSYFVLRNQFLTFILEALKYIIFQTGLLMFPVPQLLLFMRSGLLHDPVERTSKEVGNIQVQVDADSSQLDTSIPENVPDIEIACLANPTLLFPFSVYGKRGGYTFMCLALQPHSLGSVTLSSRNPRERPNCILGLFTHPNDMAVMRKAVKLTLKIGRTMKEQGYDIEPLWTPRSESDEDLDEFILFDPRCNFHFSSTCRMAPESSVSSEDDVNAAGVGKTPGVVDSQLRVHGIRGLRVADASIFPTVPACHLQAPVVLVAEKCAELIKATWV